MSADFPYLTIGESARKLSVGERQVRRLIEEDRMPRSFLWGDVWHVHEQDVAEHLERRRVRVQRRRERLKRELAALPPE